MYDGKVQSLKQTDLTVTVKKAYIKSDILILLFYLTLLFIKFNLKRLKDFKYLDRILVLADSWFDQLYIWRIIAHVTSLSTHFDCLVVTLTFWFLSNRKSICLALMSNYLSSFNWTSILTTRFKKSKHANGKVFIVYTYVDIRWK